MDPVISAAILAGGQARRFGGADKAALIVDESGTRIIDRLLAALADVADDIHIVSNAAERYRDLGVPIVPDAVNGAGPLGGLYTALVAARHDRVLVLACDLPFVTAAPLRRLIAESDAHQAADAVVARSRRGREPLVAIYRRRLTATIRAAIDAGTLKLDDFLDRITVREAAADILAPGDEERLFENVNTPHDYARAMGLG